MDKDKSVCILACLIHATAEDRFRACELRKSSHRRSWSPTDTRNIRGNTNALPASWEGMECLMGEKPSSFDCHQQIYDHVTPFLNWKKGNSRWELDLGCRVGGQFLRSPCPSGPASKPAPCGQMHCLVKTALRAIPSHVASVRLPLVPEPINSRNIGHS
ncbi:hypothetical protein EVAR_75413_1 [Eumeta japonica]|uniref:Uncharacterized protein n=1 Tax=Eumeta variegata TaxID=151549 RepID=A0A4C1TJX5_EUMVA|nr:hypothetical protein EVAR_75413_1 [Eumeta japonica]